jgi:hypothetical protein
MMFLRLIWAMLGLFATFYMVWDFIKARRAKKLLKEALLHIPSTAFPPARSRIEKAINLL